MPLNRTLSVEIRADVAPFEAGLRRASEILSALEAKLATTATAGEKFSVLATELGDVAVTGERAGVSLASMGEAAGAVAPLQGELAGLGAELKAVPLEADRATRTLTMGAERSGAAFVELGTEVRTATTGALAGTEQLAASQGAVGRAAMLSADELIAAYGRARLAQSQLTLGTERVMVSQSQIGGAAIATAAEVERASIAIAAAEGRVSAAFAREALTAKTTQAEVAAAILRTVDAEHLRDVQSRASAALSTGVAGERSAAAGGGQAEEIGALSAAGSSEGGLLKGFRSTFATIALFEVGIKAGEKFREMASEAFAGAQNIGVAVNQADTFFGQFAEHVIANTERLDSKFGFSNSQMLLAADNVGRVGRQYGLTAEAAASLAIGLEPTIGAFARFKNVGIEEASTNFNRALLGNTRSAKLLGVTLDETHLHTAALALGITTSSKAWTDQETVMIRARTIQDQLRGVTQRLADSQDTLAGRLATIRGRIENALEGLGQRATPALKGLLDGIGDVGTRLGPFFADLGAIGSDLGTILATAADAVSPLVQALGAVGGTAIIGGLTVAAEALRRLFEWISNNRAASEVFVGIIGLTLLPQLAKLASAFGNLGKGVLIDPVVHSVQALSRALATLLAESSFGPLRSLGAMFATIGGSAKASAADAALGFRTGVKTMELSAEEFAALLRTTWPAAGASGGAEMAAGLEGTVGAELDALTARAAALDAELAGTGGLAAVGGARRKATTVGAELDALTPGRAGAGLAMTAAEVDALALSEAAATTGALSLKAALGGIAAGGLALGLVVLHAEQIGDAVTDAARKIPLLRSLPGVGQDFDMSATVRGLNELGDALTRATATGDWQNVAKINAELEKVASFDYQSVKTKSGGGLVPFLTGQIIGSKNDGPNLEERLKGVDKAFASVAGHPLQLKADLEAFAQIHGFPSVDELLDKLPKTRGAMADVSAAAKPTKDDIHALAGELRVPDSVAEQWQKTADAVHLSVDELKQVTDATGLSRQAIGRLGDEGVSDFKRLADGVKSARESFAGGFDTIDLLAKFVTPIDFTGLDKEKEAVEKAGGTFDLTAERIKRGSTNILANAVQFQADLAELTKRGLNVDYLQKLATTAPERAAALAKSLVTDTTGTVVAQLNLAQAAMDQLIVKQARMATLMGVAADPHRSAEQRRQVQTDLPAAARVDAAAAAIGPGATFEQVQQATGMDPVVLRRVAAEYDLQLVGEQEKAVKLGIASAKATAASLVPDLHVAALALPASGRSTLSAAAGRVIEDTATAMIGANRTQGKRAWEDFEHQFGPGVAVPTMRRIAAELRAEGHIDAAIKIESLIDEAQMRTEAERAATQVEREFGIKLGSKGDKIVTKLRDSINAHAPMAMANARDDLIRAFGPDKAEAVIRSMGMRLAAAGDHVGSFRLLLLVSPELRLANYKLMDPASDSRFGAPGRGIPGRQAMGDVRDAHEPQMARGGEWRVWAEEETGGESYIPHAPDRRQRAQSLLARTAEILGMVAMPRTEFVARLDRDTVHLAEGGVVARHEWAGAAGSSPRPTLHSAIPPMREREPRSAAPQDRSGAPISEPRGRLDRLRERVERVVQRFATGGMTMAPTLAPNPAVDRQGYVLAGQAALAQPGAAAEIAKRGVTMLDRWFKGAAAADRARAEAAATPAGFVAAGRAGGPEVTGWVLTALAAVGAPAEWFPMLMHLVSRESGGNPSAVNRTAVLGQHATGLFQMLPSTFAAHTLPGHGNILNPIDNAISAIRYIQGRYGSPMRIPNLYSGRYQGYAEGGLRRGGDVHLRPAEGRSGADLLSVRRAQQRAVRPVVGAGVDNHRDGGRVAPLRRTLSALFSKPALHDADLPVAARASLLSLHPQERAKEVFRRVHHVAVGEHEPREALPGFDAARVRDLGQVGGHAPTVRRHAEGGLRRGSDDGAAMRLVPPALASRARAERDQARLTRDERAPRDRQVVRADHVLAGQVDALPSSDTRPQLAVGPLHDLRHLPTLRPALHDSVVTTSAGFSPNLAPTGRRAVPARAEAQGAQRASQSLSGLGAPLAWIEVDATHPGAPLSDVRRGTTPSVPPRRMGPAFAASLGPVVAERLARHVPPTEVARDVTELHRLSRAVGPLGRGSLPQPPLVALAGGALLDDRRRPPATSARRAIDAVVSAPSAAQFRAATELIGPKAQHVAAEERLRPALPPSRLADLRTLRVDRIERFDAGGILRPGVTAAINATGRDEHVRIEPARPAPLPPPQRPFAPIPVTPRGGPANVHVEIHVPVKTGPISNTDETKLAKLAHEAAAEGADIATRAIFQAVR